MKKTEQIPTIDINKLTIKKLEYPAKTLYYFEL